MENRELIERAMEALKNVYAPYSHFHVAAALLCRDGAVYTGVNVENASYSAAICAERNAVMAAVGDGNRDLEAIVICGGMDGIIDDYCPPCGICRQVMREFCNPGEFQVILAKSPEEFQEYTLEELLPRSFGPKMLGR